MSKPPYSELADGLYGLTGTDWHVRVSHILTEPVCCVVSLEADDEAQPKLVGFLGTYDINESVTKAIEHHLPKLQEFNAKEKRS